MFVITAIVGNSFRNERSLSSASATISSPRPSRALLPNALSRPPMTAVGSSPARSSTSAIIDVVVVFPCEPATAMLNRSRISSASISARGITGICRRAASRTSTLVGRTADDTTTTSASPTLPASCPCATRMPSVSSRPVTEDVFSSDPLTVYPRLASSSAMPLMPMPPIPMKWTRRVLPSTANQFQRAIDNHRRRIRPRERSRCARHPLPRRLVAGKRQNRFRQHRSRRVLLQQHRGGAFRRQGFRVLPLVVVGRGRQRNQNRRPSRRGHLRDRRRARATDDQVRVAELPSHVVKERFDVGRNPRRPLTGSHHFHISLSRLVGET